MAIFGRSFPFPRRYVNHLVGNVAPASTVRAAYVRPVRLPDRPRPFPHVTVERRVGPRSTVRAQYIRARLPDRPRPKLGVIIGRRVSSVVNTTLTAAQGSYTLTGQAAAFINSQFGDLVKARLPDRPRPFAHVTIKTRVRVIVDTPLTASVGTYTLTGQDAQFIFGRFASPPIFAVRLPDRPRPFPHVTIKKPVPAVVAGTLIASTGSYTLTGLDAALSQSQFGKLVRPVKLADRSRPFPRVFISKTPRFTVNTTLTAAQGSYTLTGETALFITTMPATFGSYALTGQAASLTTNTNLTAAFGSYTLTGNAATFATTSNVVMTASTGFYVLSGKDAGFPNALPATPNFPEGTLWGYWRDKGAGRRRKPTLLEILADVIEEDPPPPKIAKKTARQKARARAQAQRWAEEIVDRAQREARSYELDFAKATIDAALKEHAISLISSAHQRRLDQEEKEEARAILRLLSYYY